MKLTENDKRYLLEKVYGGVKKDFGADLPQIEEAADVATYTLYKGDKSDGRISRTKAIALCGREGWLSGLSRAAFHCTSMREAKGIPNLYVGFDAHRLFRR
ncbi:MAG: hypothetical protein J6Q22_09490 [Prevotella sp.]|nr:hypothetical protein [Prevotella sp.]